MTKYSDFAPVISDCCGSLQVKANLNLHGVVSIVNVTQIVEEEYEEPVKVSKPKAAAAPTDAPMQAKTTVLLP